MTMTSDIKNNGWAQRLPLSIRPYILLGRFDRPIGIWLLLLPGWWAIALASDHLGNDLGLFILFAIGATVMRAAGCTINDIWDRDLDAKVIRTQNRPLANGSLTLRQAILFLAVLCLIGLNILLQFNALTIALGFAVIPLIAIYPLMKRITWWPQAFLGLTFNFSALMGWAAVAGELSLMPILLYISAIFWTLAYDTIYAHQDKGDDLLAGIKSTALHFGKHSRLIVKLFYIMQFLMLGTICTIVSGSEEMALFLVPAFFHAMRGVRKFNPDDSAQCLKIFKSSRNTGILIFAAILIFRLF